MTKFVLAIDQGKTSTRAILFHEGLSAAGIDQMEFAQHYPRFGWVEHDQKDLWNTTLATCRGAIAKAGADAGDIAAIGITNQCETTVVWERETGRPIHNAIVWQYWRTADGCAHLKASARAQERLKPRKEILPHRDMGSGSNGTETPIEVHDAARTCKTRRFCRIV